MRSSLIPAGLIAAASLLGNGCQQSQPTSAAPNSAAPSREAWLDTFAVNKADLRSSGSAPFCVLEPGTVRTYREGETTLTITVLDETRVIDRVTTRVVEEREESAGQPLELSMNYFALDPSTGDLYYFGEDVDMYKNGRVSGHEGSWMAGVKGARFGLGLPGHPKTGQRYYQEVAPGLAMDRAEIVGVDDRVETPAGTFEHCVHVKESTPLESDSGEKWYAPGIGLVRDDKSLLVSTTRTPAR